MPCRGCYGPAGDTVDQGAKMAAALGTLIDSEDEQVIIDTIAEVVDPTGTFYCFSLPTSLLGGVRTGRKETSR
jgi:F420-non-reducing hydrogenase small subunit